MSHLMLLLIFNNYFFPDLNFAYLSREFSIISAPLLGTFLYSFITPCSFRLFITIATIGKIKNVVIDNVVSGETNFYSIVVLAIGLLLMKIAIVFTNKKDEKNANE